MRALRTIWRGGQVDYFTADQQLKLAPVLNALSPTGSVTAIGACATTPRVLPHRRFAISGCAPLPPPSLPAMPACCTASWLQSPPKQLDPADGLVIFRLADE